MTRTTLLGQPLGQPTLHFFMAYDSTGGDIGKTLLDLLANVNVVLDVLERCIFRQVLEKVLDLLLWRLHGSVILLDAFVSPTFQAERLRPATTFAK